MTVPSVLWWARKPGPDYARNRILRRQFTALGWQILDFVPFASPLGDWQARFAGVPRVDAVWVSCFRHRDLAAAARWARARNIPLIFDPLISAWDKQVFERGKFAPDSLRARRLHAWESRLLTRADRVIADTREHAGFFRREFGLPDARLAVIPIGAEEDLFQPVPMPVDRPLEVLFAGSFIALQGPQTIVEAARRYQGPPLTFTLLGDGPLKTACMAAAHALPHVRFEAWLPYTALPARLAQAHILLGVFGGGEKAGRVIPNKAYQALALGRPLVTRDAPSWAELSAEAPTGLIRTPATDPDALATRLARLASRAPELAQRGEAAAAFYRQHLSESRVRTALKSLLDGL